MSPLVASRPPTVSSVIEMRHATIDDAEAVSDLLGRCFEADGRPALSEFKELRVPVANAVRTLVADSLSGDIEVLSVAAWHPIEIGEAGGYWAAEIAIDPQLRTTAQYEAALAALGADLGIRPSFWAFDEMQAGAAIAHGMVEARAIVEMQRPLPAEPAVLPEGYTLRGFRLGADESEWLALNQHVFSHHPEAGSIDSADLALRMAQPWFDPAGLLILSHDEEEAGYCWTKLHDGSVGEIYMIGLVPEYRGRGLAKPLTRAGLEHLARAGSESAILFAEAANGAAVGLYEAMGFEVVRRLALYEPGAT